MNRKYIKDLLNCPSMIHRISKGKTQCSHNMTDFDFFKIFIEAFKGMDIELRIEDKINASFPYGYTSESNLKDMKEMIFYKRFDYYRTSFDNMVLNDKLRRYNSRLKDIGFAESTMELIEIFLSLLG